MKSKNAKIKAVVFDLDHTLYDRYETLKLVCHDLYSEKRHWFSKDIDEEQALRIMIEADGRYIVEGWRPVLRYWVEKGLLSTCTNGETVAEFSEIFDFIWNNGFLKYAVKYPYANMVLDKLRASGIKTGLITNASGEKGIARQKAKLKLLEMEDKFDSIIISGQVGILKPERGIFDIMSRRLDIAPENMLYVGDNPINDVEGSRNAGYIPVWVRLREQYGESCDCEYSVKDVSEIPALVDSINFGK